MIFGEINDRYRVGKNMTAEQLLVSRNICFVMFLFFSGQLLIVHCPRYSCLVFFLVHGYFGPEVVIHHYSFDLNSPTFVCGMMD